MDKKLKKVIKELALDKVRRHIFLCYDPQKDKCCSLSESKKSWEFLKDRLKELKLSGDGGVFRTRSGCLRVCTHGPVAVVYPEGAWYRFPARPRSSSASFRSTSSAASRLRSI